MTTIGKNRADPSRQIGEWDFGQREGHEGQTRQATLQRPDREGQEPPGR